MKKIKIIALSMVLWSAQSCTDQFINPEPRVDLLIENYYQTEAQFFDALIAAYDPLGWSYVDGIWTSNVMLGEIRSDNAKAGGDQSDSDQPGWQQIDDFLNNSLTRESEAFWKRGWWGIYRTNLIINTESDLEGEQVELIKAEAKFLRAWYHFDLFRIFGPIPVLDVILTEEDYLNVERTNISTLFEFIKTDLRDAIALLPENKYSGSMAGRVARPTAQAVLGKVLLYEADLLNDDATKFAEAADYFREVINSGQYQLLDDFADLYAFGMKNSEESVFEIQHTNQVPHSWEDGQFIDGNLMVQLCGIRGLCNNHPDYAPGWGFLLPTAELYNEFESDDEYRRTAAIISVQDLQDDGCAVDLSQTNPVDFSGYWQRKFANFNDYTAPNGGDINLQKDPNIPLIRYADVLLMAAEAISRSGGSEAEAMGYINQVRERAAGPEAPSYRTVQQLMADNGWSLLDAIWYERRAELAGEGDRWFDLVRSGRATADLFPADDLRRSNINTAELFLAIPQRDIDNTGGGLTAYPDPSLFN